MQWVTVVFDDVFFSSLWLDHHISSLYLVMWSCGHLLVCSSVHMFIWSISSSGHLVNMVLWSSGHPVIVSSGHLVIWASDHLVIRLMWSSGKYAHLVNLLICSIWSSGHVVLWSLGSFGHLFVLSSSHLVIWSSYYQVIWSIWSSGQVNTVISSIW